MKRSITTIITIVLVLSFSGCDNKDITINVKNVDLSICLKDKIDSYKKIPSVSKGSVTNSMLIVLKEDTEHIDCYLDELGISESTNKLQAVKQIHDYITIHQKYIYDKKDDDGVKYLSRYIADGGGDCEDKAMFALALMNRIGIKPYIIDVDKINGGIGHVALGLTDDFILKDKNYKQYILKSYSNENDKTGEQFITFDPSDGKKTSISIGTGIINSKYTKTKDKFEYKFYKVE